MWGDCGDSRNSAEAKRHDDTISARAIMLKNTGGVTHQALDY